MHVNQLVITEDIVRRLVGDQFPAWSGLPVRQLRTSGTDNAIFRLGDGLTARFPLRLQDPKLARDAVSAELAALGELAEVAAFPAPTPVALGEPRELFAMPWSVQTWLPGSDALMEDPAESAEFAHDLVALLQSLRQADTRGRTFGGQGRGRHLPEHDAWLAKCFEESECLLDVSPLRGLWARLSVLPAGEPDVMTHGDLTPPNLLVAEGRLVGVLDGGGFAAADPSLDLVCAWHLLDRPRRDVLRNALGCSELEWLRGAAWALQQALGLVWYYAESNPSMSQWGRRTLNRLLEGNT